MVVEEEEEQVCWGATPPPMLVSGMTKRELGRSPLKGVPEGGVRVRREAGGEAGVAGEKRRAERDNGLTEGCDDIGSNAPNRAIKRETPSLGHRRYICTASSNAIPG